MKAFKGFLLLLMTATYTFAGSGWLDDYEKAKEQAKAEGKPILIDFTGSDWCGWCVRLDNEVFSAREFKKYAKENLVLFEADFPKRKKISKKTQEQNQQLAEQFGVRGFPTIVLVDSNGEKIAQTGYREGGAEKYVEHLKELLK